MKRRNNTEKPNLWQKTSFWGILGILFFMSGAAFAFVMSLAPLRNSAASSHLTNSPAKLVGFIPGTLNQPTNILVLGIDNSGHPHQGKFTPVEALAGNSDTMLLVRLLPATHEVNVLSIPRDTLVHLNQVGIDKINDANVRGGAKLAAATVSELLNGVAIDRYVRIDTEGFIHLVDALGGVEVNIPKAMNYTDKTQHLNIHFQAGRQILNGQHLQEYVRFRHDALGDIGRVQRQQEVLKDILSTLLQPKSIEKIPQILQVVKENVDSDLSVEEMLALAGTVFRSDRHHLHLVMLPGRFSEKSEYRLSYWISDPKATSKILARYFDIQTPDTTIAQENISPSQPTNFKIAVINAPNQAESASNVVTFLRKHGFNNSYVAHPALETTAESTATTQIIAEHGNPDAANTVANTLGTGQVEVASVGDILSDVTIVVGQDLLNKLKQEK